MKALQRLAISIALVLGVATSGFAKDIYVAQNAAGGNTGSDCGNAHPAAWFNTAGNWGSGGTQIAPGDTVHLCGTFTGTAGQTMLTVQGSGSAGSPIRILFEPGAVLAAPYWGSYTAGAINVPSKSYITIDGGANGVIKNTANGTSLANKNYSVGVYVASSSHIEINGLTVQGIYVNQGSASTATDAAGANTADIRVDGSGNSISIHDNVLTHGKTGVLVTLSANSSGIDIYNNNISDHCWGINVSENAGPHTYSNLLVHDNTITNWTNWQFPSASFHTDGVIVFSQSGSTMPVQIYNNYIYGDLGSGSPTAFIFVTYGTAPPGAVGQIYNNLLVTSGNNRTAIWVKDGKSGNQIFNNTIVGIGSSSGTAVWVETATTALTFKNNVISGFKVAVASYDALSTQMISNNNIYYNINASSMFVGGSTYYTWTQWQSLGHDLNSVLSNPQLDSSYKISSANSPAHFGGINLSASGITPLVYDKAGYPRPSSEKWDIGAYQFPSSILTPPNALKVMGQ